MDYSKSLLLYRDKPASGLLLRLIFILVPAALFVTSAVLWSSGEQEGSLFILLETIIIGFVFWIVFPREYRVYEDHISIVLGGPFAIRVGFHELKEVRIKRGISPTANFVTSVTAQCVEIVKRKGIGLAITPSHSDEFVEYANQALKQWQKTSGQVRIN